MPRGSGSGRESRGGGSGKGKGRGGGFRMGPGGECVCPKCGIVKPHQQGMSCFQMQCPECGSNMTRKR